MEFCGREKGWSMETGFPDHELGSSFSVRAAMPTLRKDEASGPLKRSLTEMESLQHALFLRSVKQRTLLASPLSHHLSSPRLSGAESRPPAAVWDRLQELEQRLLLDDEDDDAVSASGTGFTTAELSEAMQQFTVPAGAGAGAGANQPSSSPTNSSSSTISSSASCSRPSPPASSLRQTLVDAAAAIADGNLEVGSAKLAVLKCAANHRGDAEQRLTAVMVVVLFSRMNPPPIGRSSPPIEQLCSAEHFEATQMLYDLSPHFKLGHMTANLAILEATKDQPRIHIIDFEVGNGGQHAALLHALAERRRLLPAAQPPLLRITAVADRASIYTSNNHGGNLRVVGDRLEKLADRACLAFQFNVVHRRAVELNAAALGCESGEALAVNLAFALARIPDESVSPENPRDEILRRVRALRPRVVTLVEQEINTNTAAFTGRFAEACTHYGALLESLDATARRDSMERARVEAGLAQRAVNSVAREGADRVERCEVFGKWRARMRMAGFEQINLRPEVIEPVKNRLASVQSNPGFTIREEAGWLGFGWKGRVLTVASTWR